MLSAVMLNVFLLSAAILNVSVLRVVMLIGMMQTAIYAECRSEAHMLNVFMLGAVL